MATYREATAIRERLESDYKRLSAALGAFPKGAMGMTPDNVRVSAEYQFAKGLFDKSFADLRLFNAYMVKNFSREMRRERATAGRG